LCGIQQEGATETAGGDFYYVTDTKCSEACCCASGLMAYDVLVDGGAFIWSVEMVQEGLLLLNLHSVEEFCLRFLPMTKNCATILSKGRELHSLPHSVTSQKNRVLSNTAVII
jgi:hypothetical protein